jgi:hypothetical protein
MNFASQSKKAMLPPLVIPNNWPAAQFSPRSLDVSPISPAEWSPAGDLNELEYALADIHEMEWADQLASLAIEEDDDGP